MHAGDHSSRAMILLFRITISHVFTLQTIEDLEERVRQANIDVVVRQNFLTDPENAVRNLKVTRPDLVLKVFPRNE